MNGPRRQGRSPFLGPQTPNELWRHDSQTNYGGAAIGRDGTVYMGTEAGRLYAFRPDGAERTSPTQIREIRVLAAWRDRLRQVCKVVFTRNDLSLYLMPHAAHGRYFYGARSFAEQEVRQTFDFHDQLSSERVPKLSLHESGQVHVRVEVQRAGPVWIPPLSTWRGQHAASISIDGFQGLPPFEGQPRTSSTSVDHVIPADPSVESGRLAIFLNGKEPTFDGEPRLTVTLTREAPPRQLFVGIAPYAQTFPGPPDPAGVVMISGWNPDKVLDGRDDYLYVRGE